MVLGKNSEKKRRDEKRRRGRGPKNTRPRIARGEGTLLPKREGGIKSPKGGEERRTRVSILGRNRSREGKKGAFLPKRDVVRGRPLKHGISDGGRERGGRQA